MNSIKLLFVPDTLFGNHSGHRSADWFIKKAIQSNIKLSVYVPFDSEKIVIAHEDYNIPIFNRNKISYNRVINQLNPELVYIFGASRFSPICRINRKNKIPYLLHFLTTYYYCPQNFATLNNLPCTKCLGVVPLNSIYNNCDNGGLVLIHGPKNLFRYKAYINDINQCKFWSAHSETQLNRLDKYNSNAIKIESPIFFNNEHLFDIKSDKIQDYIFFSGQRIEAKGWNILNKILNNTKATILTTFKSKSDAISSIKKYNLEEFHASGKLIYKTNVDSHKDLLKIISESRGVLIPSIYETTGEFTLLESMGLGKIVVCFKIGFHKDKLKNNHNALVHKLGDIEGVARSLDRLISQETNLKIIQTNAIEFVKKLVSDISYHEYFNKISYLIKKDAQEI